MEQLLPKNAIYLDEEVKAEYPTVEISSEDPTSLNFRQHKNLRPLCYHCGSHNLSYGQKYFWHRCASFQHFFCYYCFDHSLKRFNHTCVDGKPILDECKTIEHLLCGKIKFECKWPNCKKIFGGSTLRSHELSCELQPVRECPVSGCSWTGRIDLMEKEHFKEHQQAKMILRNVVLKVESDREYYLLILDKFVKVTYVIQELGGGF
ncbi:uncharacterized protein LOC126748137 [Anthonomus grandis grandis]|uniref:uncharacterized protein LOC126748137 n=1 Tax=Anthonomus grandis grandis TaxID=2921223 RepID=UPI0021661118|nr:uncharacterized protein LOC126748137 [Anthonomus grandis grandis]